MAIDGESGAIHHFRAMRVIVLAIVCGLALSWASPRLARADGDYFGKDAPEDKITFRKYKERTSKERLVIGSFFAGTALFAGVGAYFTFDSRSKANEVGVVGGHTGLIYTRDLDDTREDALRSRNLAIASYAIGGLFLAGAIVALYLTDPGSEVVSIGDEKPPKPPVPVSMTAIPGGAMIGGSWRF